MLKDSSKEVQEKSVECLAPLASFVDEHLAVYLVDKLVEPVVNSSMENASQATQSAKPMRDIAFIGLKKILGELSPTQAKSKVIAKTNIPRILQALRSESKNEDVHIEALELLNAFVVNMGPELPGFHEEVRRVIFHSLDSTSGVVRKRAIICLESLGAICNATVFQDIMSATIANLTCSTSDLKIRTGVHAVLSLSKIADDHLGSYLDVVVPIFLEFCTSSDYEKDDELREHCLLSMQSFCKRFRREMVPFIGNLTKCALVLAKHDPNYAFEESDDEDAYNSDSQEMTDAEEEEDDGFYDDDDDDVSDDDDSSWRVRRASIRCIHAIISGQFLSYDAAYSTFGLFLVSRFKEREDIVKSDVYAAFISLLHLNVAAAITELPSASMDINQMSIDMLPAPGIAVEMEIAGTRGMAPLLDRALYIVRSLRKQLVERNTKIRTNTMTVLYELVTAAPQTFTPLFGKLVSEVERALSDESTLLKTESLLFLKGVVGGGGAPSMKDYIGRLIVKILATAQDRYYKITADSLRLCEKCLCAFGVEPDDCKNAIRPLASSIYDAAEKRITASDQDSEVKEAALGCVGAAVSFFGDDLGPERLAKVGSVLCGRLKNEVTRLASVRAMRQIALSNKGSVFLPVAPIVTSTVVAFLRKNAPALRAASLELLSSIPALAPESDIVLLGHVSELISDGDLKLSHLALRLASSLVRARGAVICEELAKPDGVYEKSLKLAVSPLLQSRAVTSLSGFLRSLASVNGAPLTVERMVSDLRNLVAMDNSSTVVGSRTSPLCSIAKCVAVVCSEAPLPFRSGISSELIESIRTQDIRTRVFSLVCLGEFGKCALLSDAGEQARVQQAMLEVLDSSEVEVKTAAALALGGLASASGEGGIPALMQLISERPEIRYLLLLSLKDAIAFAPIAHVSKVIPMLLPLLLGSIPDSPSVDTANSPSRMSSGAESVRIAIAECLGLLAQSVPKEVIPSLQSASKSDNADIRASVVSSLRFAVSASSAGTSAVSSFSSDLEPVLFDFIKLADDPDVTVSKSALEAVNAIARSMPSLLAPYVDQILPLIYKRTVKNPDLVRVVDLGPFQHEEDFGLDLRKAAFSSMRTLISGPLSHLIPMDTFIEKVVYGLRDQADVRASAQLILAAVALSPYAPHIIGMLEAVITALTATLNERLKENAVRQEVERHNDSIRGALRAVRVMEKVPDISSSSVFQGFLTSVVQRRFADKYKAIISETDMMSMKQEVERYLLRGRLLTRIG